MTPNIADQIIATLHARIDELVAHVETLHYEVDAIPAIKAERDALAAAAKRALEALTHYANTYNWDEDFHGIRRKWLEPETSTPRAYNGFELAQKTLAALKKAGVQ